MRLLACGGRNFWMKDMVFRVLDDMDKEHGIEALIEGGATGADALAALWAESRKKPRLTFKIELFESPFMRNERMLRVGKPTAAVSFAGGNGTADMVRRVVNAGLPVWCCDYNGVLSVVDPVSFSPASS